MWEKGGKGDSCLSGIYNEVAVEICEQHTYIHPQNYVKTLLVLRIFMNEKMRARAGSCIKTFCPLLSKIAGCKI